MKMGESEKPAFDPNQEFSMLDEILTQTQRYSELLLEELPTESTGDEASLTEEEKLQKEQDRLIPSMTSTVLQPCLVKGVKWLIFLWKNGLNGILEDQTGFKAVFQTLVFLAHLKDNGVHGPYMIVASQYGNSIPRWSSLIR
jgi:ATP-dependent DNA helicase